MCMPPTLWNLPYSSSIGATYVSLILCSLLHFLRKNQVSSLLQIMFLICRLEDALHSCDLTSLPPLSPQQAHIVPLCPSFQGIDTVVFNSGSEFAFMMIIYSCILEMYSGRSPGLFHGTLFLSWEGQLQLYNSVRPFPRPQ